MKQIIIETNINHFCYILSLIDNLKLQTNETVIATEKNVIKDLTLFMKSNNYPDIAILDISKRSNFLNKNYKNIYINTLPNSISIISNFRRINKLKGETVYLTVHNINSWFNVGYFNLKSIVLYFVRKLISIKINKYIVLNRKIADYTKKFTNKEIITIPFKSKLEQYKLKKNNIMVQFCIPGNIDSKRRNYNDLFDVIDTVLKKSDKSVFYFLGQIKDNLLLGHLEKMENTYDKRIVFFRERISDKNYEHIISKSHIIISPLQKEIRHNTNIEFYGISKASGAEFDALRYDTELVIPDFYEVLNKDINVFYYKNDFELEKILIGLYEKNITNIQ